MTISTLRSLSQRASSGAQRAGLELQALRVMKEAGAIGGSSPRQLAQILGAIRTYGSVGGAVRIAAIKHPEAVAIADERGEITYGELDEQINRLVNAFAAMGLEPGDSVAMLCRNHRSPLIVCFAASRAGLKNIWLNTGFSARQATEVIEREGVDLLVHDAEFTDTVKEVDPRFGKFAVSVDGSTDDELDALIATASPADPPGPAKPGKIILLTSGTTGTPKGAPRTEPKGLVVPASVLERMPMKAGEATVIGPPIFHGTGLLITLLNFALGSKLVLRAKFDPAQLLDDVEAHRATTICLVPIMLQRILALGEDEIGKRDLSSLKCIFTAGSQLPAEVSTQAQQLLGDVVYNLYGSTEESVATLATPEVVHEAPTTVGKPALGVRIKILDDKGKELPTGETGRIFVGATMQFEGYTGGGHKEIIDGLMSTGDVGHFDAKGYLYIDGRDDEMIVSGGENVFPREVEELLITHDAIADVAVIGVEDPEFGQRLRAFCVLAPGKEVTEKALQDFVKENLARYKVPRDVVFLDDLPRNPTGKILKRELAQLP
jgi:fatty-acyl-CoA synthase